ncbi:hypothetical protein [Simkania negevensis]|uniref:Lipoprotein n=1 Tax=Simkania negevensis (strain ATCC VR-1471 / DSM 27360 / Z) TaxID=331113 RepID=F8L574_SIMNZ|nr:hypothetical protein [Simkania negevensis]CCB87955.1 hypothetical protein SNE_A00770 [Simkania negevensis Z]
MRRLIKIGIVFTLIIAFLGCSSFGHRFVDYERIADRITAKTAKKLEKQKNLRLIGTGGGMMNDIQMMEMSFQYFQEVDLQKARELVVYAVKEYLTDINSNEKVRPYLHEYPFTAKNVEIRIWIYNPDRSRLPSDKIYYISSIDGVLSYYIRGPEEYSRLAVCEETYEEALKQTKMD